jgi:putative tryptophan/tyrosine transport system substrate-binding protein
MAIHIGRREFITLLGGAATWPLAARAQQAAMPVIGVLAGGTPAGFAPLMAAFQRGLSEEGNFIEGQNVAIEYRWSESQNEQLPALAADLVDRQVAVIATLGSTPAARAAKAATTTVPLVFYTAFDPVKIGLVSSLSRPGGNATGVTSLGVEVGGKRLELLHELMPTETSIGLLVNPTNTLTETLTKEVQAPAVRLGLRVHVLNASTERDFDAAFLTLARLGIRALLLGNDGFFYNRRNQLSALAERYGVAAVYPWRDATTAGGLISYGGNLADAYRQVGVYVARVLKGDKPADLPVQQATKVELVINLKTAKVLGLTVPDTLLARADEVIE